MKKLIYIILSSLLFSNLYALDDKTQAIKYFENIGKQPDIKNTVSKINDLMGSIETYIVSTGANPSYLSNKLSLDVSKATLIKDDILEANYLESNYNITDDNFYSLVYDKNNLIPVGIKFDIKKIGSSQIFTESNSNLLDKTIAYLNSNGIVKDKDGDLIKYFNPNAMSSIKQMYFIKKDNPTIQFLDTSKVDPKTGTLNGIVYSPDGKGGFLIYQNTADATTGERLWTVVGEPEIELTINSTDDLGNVKLPLGGKVTVLNDGGRAIEYTMQSALDMGSGTSTNVWNKTTGSYEKNYYFNPIKISDISLGVSSVLKQALGNWDGHTFIRDTFIDTIQYEPIYETVKDEAGNDKLDKDGKVIYQLDEGGEEIMIAQSLTNIIGHIKYDGGLGSGGVSYSYEGKYHTSNFFGANGGRLYFEIMKNELELNKNVDFIGNSTNINISTNDVGADYPCPASFGGGPIIYLCDVWISLNRIASLQYTKTLNYKESGVNLWKVPNAFEFVKDNYLPKYETSVKNYNNCINSLKTIYGNYYYKDYEYLCNSYKTLMDNNYQNVKCLNDGNCNTSFACHHDTGQCVYLPVETIRSGISNSEFNMTLGCYEGARITYIDEANGKNILKQEGEVVRVNAQPTASNNYTITIDFDPTLEVGNKNKRIESFPKSGFNIQYITIDTFGSLQCIKRNNSDYGQRD